MENNNKLDLLTKKIYEEGIEKANQDAKDILQKSNQQAESILKEAQDKAKAIVEAAKTEAANLRQKTEAEMGMSIKQAVAALKQQITNLISDEVAKKTAKTAFSDKEFVQKLMAEIIKKWNPDGNADLAVMMNAETKAEFEKYLSEKHKELLDNKLTLKVNNAQKEGFVIQPKDGSYKITFSEAVFEEFFNLYIKEYSKKLLFK